MSKCLQLKGIKDIVDCVENDWTEKRYIWQLEDLQKSILSKKNQRKKEKSVRILQNINEKMNKLKKIYIECLKRDMSEVKFVECEFKILIIFGGLNRYISSEKKYYDNIDTIHIYSSFDVNNHISREEDYTITLINYVFDFESLKEIEHNWNFGEHNRKYYNQNGIFHDSFLIEKEIVVRTLEKLELIMNERMEIEAQRRVLNEKEYNLIEEWKKSII